MAKTGRPRRNSIEAFAAAIDACIAAYENSDDAHDLTDYALAQRLKLSIDQLDAYYEGEPDRAIARVEARERAKRGEDSTEDSFEDGSPIKRTYHGELKRLIQYRSAACVAHIARGGQVTGWIFLSKQKRWGGFSDVQKQETTGRQEITVTLKGADGRELH
nr:MAG TPA: hypothetical protein [Caudoviricetes sp.]